MCAEIPGLRRWVVRGLLTIGIACLGWSGVASLTATWYQREQHETLERIRAAASSEPTAVPATVAPGGLIGSLDIARLRLSAVIAQGDDDATLEMAIGHLPDTPLPWQDGNSALAAHRDTFFRPLEHIRVGDELHLSTTHGDFRYQVRETMVVGPRELWVLEPTGRPTLTLITCYPFRYVGKAPRRFVVRAERRPGRLHVGDDVSRERLTAGSPEAGDNHEISVEKRAKLILRPEPARPMLLAAATGGRR